MIKAALFFVSRMVFGIGTAIMLSFVCLMVVVGCWLMALVRYPNGTQDYE